MPFSKSSTSPPQTVKSLARMHVKVPDSNHHRTLVSWLQPRKVPRPAVGYRRVMHTAPPASLPTLRNLSIGRRHSTPSSVPQHNSASSSHPTQTRTTGLDAHANSPTSGATSSAKAPKAPLFVSATAVAATPSSAKKPYLYTNQRIAPGSPRWASDDPNHPVEPESRSPKTSVSRRRATPLLSHNAGRSERRGGMEYRFSLATSKSFWRMC
ncbi:hypothetical protein B0H12DRAFT_1244625 [Mycena haematopus]|nr:hypothetical protein B0H12DRAFT_1244625 [Mycena haematopus]